MTRSEIAAVACRLLAMAMFALAGVTAARVAADYIVERSGENSVRQAIDAPLEYLSPRSLTGLNSAVLAGGAVWLLFGTYYWQRADKLGRMMADDDSEAVTSEGLTADDATAAGCRLIGVVLSVYALRSLSWLAADFTFADREADFFSPGRLQIALRAAFEAALATWFFLGTQGIVGLVAWARRAGSERREQIETELTGSRESDRKDGAEGQESARHADASPQAGASPDESREETRP